MRRRGSDRAMCAYLKQPNAMTQGASKTDHLSSPTACISTMRSSKACTSGGSTTGACPRCPVALGVAGTCKFPSSILVGVLVHPLQGLECSRRCLSMVQELIKVYHLWRSGSPPTLQEGSQRQPCVHHSVNGSLFCVLHLLLGNPSARLLPFHLEVVCQDACWFVRAHANEHGDQAIHPLLNGFTQVLVHVDGFGLLLADRLAHRAKSYRTLRVVLHDFGPSCKELFLGLV